MEMMEALINRSVACEQKLGYDCKRSRSVMNLSLGVSTVETNRDRDRDLVFQTVETFLTYRDNTFKVLRLRVSIETRTKFETLGH